MPAAGRASQLQRRCGRVANGLSSTTTTTLSLSSSSLQVVSPALCLPPPPAYHDHPRSAHPALLNGARHDQNSNSSSNGRLCYYYDDDCNYGHSRTAAPPAVTMATSNRLYELGGALLSAPVSAENNNNLGHSNHDPPSAYAISSPFIGVEDSWQQRAIELSGRYPFSSSTAETLRWTANSSLDAAPHPLGRHRYPSASFSSLDPRRPVQSVSKFELSNGIVASASNRSMRDALHRSTNNVRTCSRRTLRQLTAMIFAAPESNGFGSHAGMRGTRSCTELRAAGSQFRVREHGSRETDTGMEWVPSPF